MCGYTHNAHTELKQSNYIQTAKHIILLLNTNKWLVCTNSDWSLTALCPWHTERALLLLLVGILESDTGGTFFSRKCMLDLWIMCNIVIPTINQVRICCGKGCDDLLAEHWYRPIFTLLAYWGMRWQSLIAVADVYLLCCIDFAVAQSWATGSWHPCYRFIRLCKNWIYLINWIY